MAARRTTKVTRNCKLNFEVRFEALVGFPSHGKSSQKAPEFQVEWKRGDSNSGFSKVYSASVDERRARDLLPYGLGDCPPTVAKIEESVTFTSTLQRKNDFAYKEKKLILRVLDNELGTAMISAEIDLGKSVDKEVFPERTFELMNTSQNKCLVAIIKGSPIGDKEKGGKAAATESQRAAGPEAAEQQPAAAPGSARGRTGSPGRRPGSPGSARGPGSARRQDTNENDELKRTGSARDRRNRRQQQPTVDDDEFGELLDSVNVEEKTSPKQRRRPASPSPNPTPPPGSRQRVDDVRGTSKPHNNNNNNQRQDQPPAGSLLAASNNQQQQVKSERSQPKFDEEEDEAPVTAQAKGEPEANVAASSQQPQQSQSQLSAAAAEEEPSPAAAEPSPEPESDGEQYEARPPSVRKERADNSMIAIKASSRPIIRNARGDYQQPSKRREPTPPQRNEDPEEEEAQQRQAASQHQEAKTTTEDENPEDVNVEDQSPEKLDGAALGLEPVTAEDRQLKNDRSQPRQTTTTTGSVSHTKGTVGGSSAAAAPTHNKRSSVRPPAPQVGAQMDAVSRTVNLWLKDIRNSALLEVDDRSVKHSKRQSLSLEEREAPMPPASQIILEALHVARVPNGELSYFVGDLIGQVLYNEVCKNTRHYGMWVRVLLHVIEELVIYYYPSKDELHAGTNMDEMQEEQDYFLGQMMEIMQEKNDRFTNHQQQDGIHVDYILDNALNRNAYNGTLGGSRWEVEENREDREDRIFLHAFVVIEVASVVEQLCLLATDRVSSQLHRHIENFSFESKKGRLLPPESAASQSPDSLSNNNFIFSVTQQRSRSILASSTTKGANVGKPQMFSSELGSSGWLPALIQELDALFISLAAPKPVEAGTALDLVMKSRSDLFKKSTVRTRTMLAQIYKPIFFNIQCTLINLMHAPNKKESAPNNNNKRSNTNSSASSAETMQLRSAKDAMNLKLTISALEQWLQEHGLYAECRKQLLPLRQICDLYILSKSIFVQPKTRMDVCGLVPEELMFHALHQFKPDDREVVPDSVPQQLLESLASSLGLRNGIKKTAGMTTDEYAAAVAASVSIPKCKLEPVEFGVNHIDFLIERQKKRAGQDVEDKTDSSAIQDSMEWDLVQ